MNEELRSIYEADQADRRNVMAHDPAVLMERDRARLRRVDELLAAGEVRDGDDHYHAAMVFQHGDMLDDYLRARELALKAVDLGNRNGRWLAAAALDRWLMRQGQPQKYGTQYRAEGERWRLYDVDGETTDAERAAWDVPPLAECERRAEELDRRSPPRPRSGGPPQP